MSLLENPLNLRTEALKLAQEKPRGWEWLLFGQVLNDELRNTREGTEQKSDFISKTEWLTLMDILGWYSGREKELQHIASEIEIAFAYDPDEVFGPTGKPGDLEKIVALARRIASYYQQAVEWSSAVRNVSTDSMFSELPVELAAQASGIIGGIEQYAKDLSRAIDAMLRAPEEKENPRQFEVTLHLRRPSHNEHYEELVNRLGKMAQRLLVVTNQGLKGFVGQESLIEKLGFQVTLAQKKKTALNHILICGPDGEGKAFLGKRISEEMKVSIKSLEGSAIERPGDLAALLTNLRAGDILLIEHIEQLNQQCVSVLVPAMRDFAFDIVIGKGSAKRSVRLKAPRFTLVGTTAHQGAIRESLRDAFNVLLEIAPYDQASLETLILVAAIGDRIRIDTSAATEIAKHSNGRLQIARKLFKQVNDYAIVHDHKTITSEVVLGALGLFPDSDVKKDKTGIAFELKCMNLLRQRDFEVKSTRRTSDGGIDLVASSDDPFTGGRYIVQCKDWSNPVGAPVVRDLYGVVHAENANKGILITASSFTQEALDFARGKRLELIDGSKLNYLLA